jgi:hypothetical protein
MPVMRDLPFYLIIGRMCQLSSGNERGCGQQAEDTRGTGRGRAPRWQQAIPFGDEGPPKNTTGVR